MSKLKKIAAGLLSVVMMLALASCGENTSWIGKNGDTEIPAGVYLYYQIQAYYDATNQQTDKNTDLLKTTIEEKPAKDWINDKAVDYVKDYIATTNKFAELGLTLSDDDKAVIQKSTDDFWDQSKDMMTKNGISEDSMKLIVTQSTMQDKIYTSYYYEGGTEEVSKQDINNALQDTYMRVKYIAIQLKDGEGNLFKSTDKAKAMDMAEDYVKRAETKTFDSLIDEYTDYYTKLVKDATDADTTDKLSSKSDTEGDYQYEEVMNTDSKSPSENFVNTVKEKKPSDTPFIIQEDEVYYVVQKLDITDREDLYNTYKDSMIYKLKGDEFLKLKDDWKASAQFEINEEAFKRYDPKNIKLK